MTSSCSIVGVLNIIQLMIALPVLATVQVRGNPHHFLCSLYPPPPPVLSTAALHRFSRPSPVSILFSSLFTNPSPTVQRPLYILIKAPAVLKLLINGNILSKGFLCEYSYELCGCLNVLCKLGKHTQNTPLNNHAEKELTTNQCNYTRIVFVLLKAL